MIKLKNQWEMLAREREEKLQSELHQRLIEATEKLELEEKVESSWREIKHYQVLECILGNDYTVFTHYIPSQG